MASTQKFFIETKNKHTIRVIHNSPPERALAKLDRKLFIMMHGFPGHKAGHNDLYSELEFILLDHGFHTLRFDFIGCGESSGEQEDFSFANARACIDVIKEWAGHNGYKEFIFISEGIGSTVALLNHDTNVTCHVMLWPGLNPPALAKSLFNSGDKSNQLSWDKSGFAVVDDNRIGKRFIQELLKINLIPNMRDTTSPILILQGSDDNRFPAEGLNIARKYMNSKRIEITTFHDGLHGLIDLEHRKSLFTHVTQFLIKYA